MKNSLLMYSFQIVDHFRKQLKKLIKKDRNLKEKIIVALQNFNRECSIPIGSGVYKVRVQGQNKGKSGGYRLYLYVMEMDQILVPIAIYSKNERENLSFDEMCEHLNRAREELTGL